MSIDACSFSFEHYAHILRTAQGSGYHFGTYAALETASRPTCVLRHDVDYTPERALAFGEIEHRLGIRSYYFVLINSAIYNLREDRHYRVFQALKKMGHEIGLHFDLSWDPDVAFDDIPRQCDREKAILRTLTDIEPCSIISFHNPHKFTDVILNQAVAGMEHTYEKRYFTDTKYLSDSQGWYEGCPCRVFSEKRYPKIQLLLHPYLWAEAPRETFTQDMAAMVREKAEFITEYLVRYHPVAQRNQDELRRLTTMGAAHGGGR
jgi:hypothetical protein